MKRRRAVTLAGAALTVTAAVALAALALAFRAADAAGSGAAAGAERAPGAGAAELEVWVTHGLDKVRPNDPPGTARRAEIAAARKRPGLTSSRA